MPTQDPVNPTLKGAIWNVMNLGVRLVSRANGTSVTNENARLSNTSSKINFIMDYIARENLDFAVLMECGEETIEYFQNFRNFPDVSQPVSVNNGNKTCVVRHAYNGELRTYTVDQSETTGIETYILISTSECRDLIHDFQLFGTAGLTIDNHQDSARRGLFFRIERGRLNTTFGVVHAPSPSHTINGRETYLNDRIAAFNGLRGTSQLRLFGGDLNFEANKLSHSQAILKSGGFGYSETPPWAVAKTPKTSLRQFHNIVKNIYWTNIESSLSQPYDQIWSNMDTETPSTSSSPPSHQFLSIQRADTCPNDASIVDRTTQISEETIRHGIKQFVFSNTNIQNDRQDISQWDISELFPIFKTQTRSFFDRESRTPPAFNDEQQKRFDSLHEEIDYLKLLLASLQLKLIANNASGTNSPYQKFSLFLTQFLAEKDDFPILFWKSFFAEKGKDSSYAMTPNILDPVTRFLGMLADPNNPVVQLASYRKNISDHLPVQLEINLKELDKILNPPQNQPRKKPKTLMATST